MFVNYPYSHRTGRLLVIVRLHFLIKLDFTAIIHNLHYTVSWFKPVNEGKWIRVFNFYKSDHDNPCQKGWLKCWFTNLVVAQCPPWRGPDHINFYFTLKQDSKQAFEKNQCSFLKRIFKTLHSFKADYSIFWL